MAVVRITYDVEDQSVLEATAAVNQLNNANEQAEKSTKELGDESEESAEAMESLGDEVKNTANQINIMGVGLGDAATRLTAVTKSTSLWGVALKALPLVAVAGALASVATFLTKTQRGQDLLQVSTAKLSAGIAVLRDRIISYGESIVKSTTNTDGFIKRIATTNPLVGQLVAGIGLLSRAFPELTKEITEEVEAAGRLEEQFIANRDAQLALNVVVAQNRAEIEQQKLVAEDLTQTNERRIQAATRAFQLENDLLEQQTALAEERVEILREQQALGENTLEDNIELAEAQIALANIQQESLTKQIELNNKVNAIQKEAIAQTEAEAAAVEALRAADEALAEQRALEAEIRQQRELDAITELAALQEEARENFEEAEKIRRERLLENEELTAAERELIIAQSEMKILAIKKNADDEELRLEQEKVQQELALQQQLFSNVSTLLGKSSTAGKLAASAQATIDTYAAANKALASAPPPFSFLLAATTIAAGLANVARINTTNTDIPQFAEGVIDLQGPGTSTSDSINARLSKGESVMTAKETSDFMPTLKAIRKGQVDAELLNSVSVGRPAVIDATKIIETPRDSFVWDEQGFTTHLRRGNSRIQKKKRMFKN